MTSLLKILALFFVVFALVGCSPKTTSPASDGAAPAAESAVFQYPLQLDYEDTLDLGLSYDQELKHGSFSVKNISSQPQTVTGIIPTCDCVRMDRSYAKTVLQPGESLTVGFTMDVSTVDGDSYGRYIEIDVQGAQPLQARFGARIFHAVEVTPDDQIELGKFSVPTKPWEEHVEIRKNPEMKEPLVLGTPRENPFVTTEISKIGEDTYDVKMTPKRALPYGREFYLPIFIPIVEPAAARHVQLVLTASVAEVVSFAPDKWKIQREKLVSAGSLTERFVYGEVPGVQEERGIGDSAANTRNMLKKSLLRQHNAVPLKFVKENHDWDDLFANLQYEVPSGVTLEKIRHPQGIELKITVTPEAFATEDTVKIRPFRDGVYYSPIEIKVVE